MAPVRIIGGGLIGSRLGRLMAAEDRCELVAVADPAPAGEDLAAELGVAWFADYEAMLGPVAPDGVVVATPNQMHLPAAVACAAHGAHILMEKPIADSVAAGRELVAAVRGADVGMTVAVFWSFGLAKRPGLFATLDCPNLQALRDRLEATPAFRAVPPETEILSNQLGPRAQRPKFGDT